MLEIRKLKNDELTTKVLELKEQLFTLRIELATGNLEQTHTIKELKKDIARMKLVLNARELGHEKIDSTPSQQPKKVTAESKKDSKSEKELDSAKDN